MESPHENLAEKSAKIPVTTEQPDVVPETEKPKSPFDALTAMMNGSQQACRAEPIDVKQPESPTTTSSDKPPMSLYDLMASLTGCRSAKVDGGAILENLTKMLNSNTEKTPLVDEMLNQVKGMASEAVKNGGSFPEIMKLLQPMIDLFSSNRSSSTSHPVFHARKHTSSGSSASEKPVLNVRLGEWALNIESQKDGTYPVSYQRNSRVIHRKFLTGKQLQTVIYDLACGCDSPLKFGITWNLGFLEKRTIDHAEATHKKPLKRVVRYFVALI